jgi:hypothetical protein
MKGLGRGGVVLTSPLPGFIPAAGALDKKAVAPDVSERTRWSGFGRQDAGCHPPPSAW